MKRFAALRRSWWAAVGALRCGNQDIGAVKLLHCWVRVQSLYEVLWYRIAGSLVLARQMAICNRLPARMPTCQAAGQRTSARSSTKCDSRNCDPHIPIPIPMKSVPTTTADRGGPVPAPPRRLVAPLREARRHVSGTAAAGARGAAARHRRRRRRRLARGQGQGQGQAVTLLTGSAASTLAAVLADSRNSGTHFQPTPIPARRLMARLRTPQAQVSSCLSALPVLIVTHRSLPSSR